MIINVLKIYKTTLTESQSDYVKEITKVTELPTSIVNESFTEYLTKRNHNIPEELYAEFTN